MPITAQTSACRNAPVIARPASSWMTGPPVARSPATDSTCSVNSAWRLEIKHVDRREYLNQPRAFAAVPLLHQPVRQIFDGNRIGRLQPLLSRPSVGCMPAVRV